MRRAFAVLSARYPKLVQSLTALVLVLSLPLLVFAALTVQNLVQKASSSNVVKIVNSSNDPITETTDPVVNLQISLPSDWVLPGSFPKPPDQPDGAFLPIQKAYAQEDQQDTDGTTGGGNQPSAPIQAPIVQPITQPIAQPSAVTNCSSFNNCGDCLAQPDCVFTEGQCINVNPKDEKVVNCPTGKTSWYWTNCQTNACTSLPARQPTVTTAPQQPTQTQQPQSTKHILQSITIENQGDISSKKTFSTQTEIINLLSTPKQWQLKNLEPNQQEATRIVVVTLSDGTTTREFTASVLLKKDGQNFGTSDDDILAPKDDSGFTPFGVGNFNNKFLDIPNRKSLEDRYLQKLEEIPPDLYDKSLFRPLSVKAPSENCLTVGFWVEKGFEDFFDPKNNQQFRHVSKNTFEEWAKTQIGAWNYIFDKSGIMECVGLGKIVRVDDNALPLGGAHNWPTNMPDIRDRSVDIVWGFPTKNISKPEDKEYWNRVLNGVDWALLHEMSHARYIVDEYTVDVGEENSKIEVKDPQGDLVVGKYFKRIKQDVLYYNKSQDLMGGGEREDGIKYAPHQAGAFNRILHQHNAEKVGNFNPPFNLGIYLDDLPANNILRILDIKGRFIKDARVRIYQSIPKNDNYAFKYIDNNPDITGITDTEGKISVGSNPFGNIPISLSLGAPLNKKIYPNGNNAVFILEVFYNDNVFYKFIEVSDFNLAYWAGHTQEAEYEIQTDLDLDKIPPSKQEGISDEQYEAFKACFKKDLSFMPSCRLYDFDKDGDVDERDYLLFLDSLKR